MKKKLTLITILLFSISLVIVGVWYVKNNQHLFNKSEKNDTKNKAHEAKTAKGSENTTAGNIAEIIWTDRPDEENLTTGAQNKSVSKTAESVVKKDSADQKTEPEAWLLNAIEAAKHDDEKLQELLALAWTYMFSSDAADRDNAVLILTSIDNPLVVTAGRDMYASAADNTAQSQVISAIKNMQIANSLPTVVDSISNDPVPLQQALHFAITSAGEPGVNWLIDQYAQQQSQVASKDISSSRDSQNLLQVSILASLTRTPRFDGDSDYYNDILQSGKTSAEIDQILNKLLIYNAVIDESDDEGK